jgi:dihydroorotate dehydrogenase (NAD+) catalytic subunit
MPDPKTPSEKATENELKSRPYINLVRAGKFSLQVQSPVMPAAGTYGWGDAYNNMIDVRRLGAVVTHPITYQPWLPARGTRVVSLPAGALVHTGLPNRGVRKVVKEHSKIWENSPVPVIAHLVATNEDDIRKAGEILDATEGVDAIELGLTDDIPYDEAYNLVVSAVDNVEKPVLVRLPMQDAYEIASAVVDAGAHALVIAGAPRGTARDPRSGQLVSGRVYSPTIQPLILRMVGVLRQRLDIPIIGAGGIHSTQHARDFLDAGAVAVQVDAVTWIKPLILERIARDLTGALVTRHKDAFLDEWHPDMGDTEYRQRFGDDDPAEGIPSDV